MKKMAKEITLIERLQLIKAGYNKKEINEMIMMADQETSAAEEPAENTSKGDAEPEPKKAETIIPADENKDEPDYKTMYADLQKQVESLTSKLEAAQKVNINTDVSKSQPKVSTSETINNIFREVIS